MLNALDIMMKAAFFVFVVWITCVQGHGDSLEAIFEEYWQWYLEEFPETATWTGDNRWNGRRESFNMSVYTERKEAVQRFRERLSGIGLTGLEPSEKTSYYVLDYNLKTYIEGYQWFKYGAINPISFMEGPQTDPDSGIGDIKIRTSADFEDCLSRIAGTRKMLSEMISLMREAIRLSRTLHNVSMSRVPDHINQIVERDPRNSSLFNKLSTGLEKIMSISSTERESLRSRALQVIQNDYVEPFRALRRFITQEYMPNTRTGYGVDSWTNGREYYKSCLKWHLSADKTPQQIHQLGLQEVSRISQEMYKIMRKQKVADYSIPQYFNALKKFSATQFHTSEAIIQEYTRLIQRIDPHLYKIFKDIPNLPVEVRSTPLDGSSAYYTAGQSDGSTPGIFWANTMRPNETFSFDMLALVAHEVNPGHHFQISYSMKQDSPNFRKFPPYVIYSAPFGFPSYTAFVEGWALYAETLVEELRLYKDNYEMMGRYSSEIFRACRLVVDTGIHAFGWSKHRAIEYMMNYTSFSYTDTEKEIDRYITWPGQACAYKFGELKLREEKKRATKSLGKLFDVKEFHATILDLGSSPLEMVERAVDDLITKKLTSGSQELVLSTRAVFTSFTAVLLLSI